MPAAATPSTGDSLKEQWASLEGAAAEKFWNGLSKANQEQLLRV